MVKRKWPFSVACQHPGCTFVANGSTELASRTGLARHTREQHSATGVSCRTRRQEQQKQRLHMARKSQPLLLQGWAKQHRFAVTCPLRREAMWTSTHEGLMRAGVPAACVVRRKGIDFDKYTEDPGRRPEGLKRSTFLMWDFHKGFLPRCKFWFASEAELQFIWWVEDDCALKANVDFTALHAHALAGRACLHWAGYLSKRGQPHWGTHLVAVSREGLPHLEARLSQEAAKAAEGGNSLAYLRGFDTWIRGVLAIEQGGMPLVRVLPKSVAQQRRHALRGRR